MFAPFVRILEYFEKAETFDKNLRHSMYFIVFQQ